MANGPERWWQRHLSVFVAMAGLAAVLALGIVLGIGNGTPGPVHHSHVTNRTRHRQYVRVLSALSMTTAASSFDFTFDVTDTPGSSQSPLKFDGHGVVNTDPYVTVSMSAPGSDYGTVTLVVNDTDAWEFGAGNFGVTPGSNTGPGVPLTQFGQIVESSIGNGEGALSMMGLADPAGRLDLASNMFTSANETGTGSVDGVPVTVYAVSIDMANEVDQPGLSAQQQATVSQALSTMREQGYEGTSESVSIDPAGYIVEIKATASFSSGGSVVSDETFSNFGCGGTVTPGSAVVQAPPPGCVSSDQPTTVPTPASTTSTTPSTTLPAPPTTTSTSATPTSVTTTTSTPSTTTTTTTTTVQTATSTTGPPPGN
jgi:hypothetical protein